MLKSIIVDDESGGRQVLQSLLAPHASRIEIVAVCESANEAIKAIEKHHPDLVFLDIEMPGGSGFTVLEEVKFNQFDVIFTTAHNKYAIQAFRYSAMDYLLKPIIREELEQAIVKAEDKHKERFFKEKLTFFMESIQHKNKPLERIAIHTVDGFHIIRLSNIIRLEADNNYTRFYLTDNEKIMVAKTLKEYDEMLSEAGFLRVHQSNLINMSHVKRYIKGEGGIAMMTDGAQVEISRRNKAQFLAEFEENQ